MLSDYSVGDFRMLTLRYNVFVWEGRAAGRGGGCFLRELNSAGGIVKGNEQASEGKFACRIVT